MKRQFWLWAGICLFILMSGCTGTVTTRTPLFLVVGMGDEASGQVALIEDMFFRDEFVLEQRFRFIEESTRPVGGKPIAEDVVDRIDSRRQLVVLSRGVAPVGEVPPAYLDFFNLEGIEPTDPFAFTHLERLLINELPTAEIDPLYCPINVQVSRNGRFVALLNNPSSCNLIGSPSIDIIDLEGIPAVVRHVETPPILAGARLQTAPGAFYLDQRTNRVYYFEESTGALLRFIQLNEATGVVALGPSGPMLPLPSNQMASHLNRMGDTLVALMSDPAQLAPILLAGPIPVEGERVTTLQNPRRLIVDEQDLTPAVLVLSNSQLIVHTTLEDLEPRSALVTAVDGTIESNEQFAYLVNTGYITLFDLYTYLASPPATGPVFRAHPVPELVRPTFVTWVQAVTPELVP